MPYRDTSARDLIWQTDLSRAELARRLGRDERTIEAYRRGRPMPTPTRALLEVLAGAMPWPEFAGFTVCRGAIYPPGLADGIPAAVLPTLPYTLRRLEILDRELKRLRALPVQYLLEFGPGA